MKDENRNNIWYECSDSVNRIIGFDRAGRKEVWVQDVLNLSHI
jgi:hypothetical protein